MKLTAYLRVSTDRQAEHGLGLDVQRAAIRTWASASGHRIVAWRADEGISGSNGLDSRVALAEALADLKGASGGIVVYRLDRLARDLIIQETLIADVRRSGGEIFTTASAEADYLADDPDDPSRKLIRQILGAVNEYERSMIALRMRAGKRIKASRGGYAGHGSPAYGHNAVNHELVADQEQQRVIGRMREMRDQGASYARIAADLNASGIPPKRGAGRWHAQTVSRVLAR